MSRPRATGVGALIVALATGLLFPLVPATEAAASSCTGWTSTVVPPPHINVLRTSLGRVDTVPFRRYVEYVLAAEWGPSNPREAVAAGAVAIKQYAWYHALAGHWRGGHLGGTCFDVRDTNVDQVYRPASKIPTAGQRAAVAESWGVTLRKPDGTRTDGRFFVTSYNGGSAYRRCGSGVTGWKLWQVGAATCAAEGLGFQRILRIYYGTSVRLVTVADHDLDASGFGDAGLFVDRELAENRTTDALVLSSNGRALTLRSDQPLGFSLADLRSSVTADLTGDGRADLAVLLDAGDGLEVRVFPGTGHGFGLGETWWVGGTASVIDATLPVRLVTAGWNADPRSDLGLVGQRAGSSDVTVVERLRFTGDAVKDAGIAWQGRLDGTLWQAYGADFTGDGRTDVAMVVQRTGGGLALDVLPSGPGSGALGSPLEWGHQPQLTPDGVLPLAADVDGDGREDLILVTRSGDAGLDFTLYRATGTSFARSSLLHVSSGFPWTTTRAGTADLNGDSRDDLYLLTKDGSGTRVDAFLSRGGTLALQTWGRDLDLDPTSATTF